jgi:hypothetical protein
MSLCGTVITLALNATLLGQQALEVSSAREVPLADCSAQNESENPNAVLSLKDGKGNVVFSQKIRVADFDFYLTETQRGGAPAREAVIFVNVPRTKATAKAKTVELAMNDHDYKQSTRMPASIEGLK